VAQPYIGEIRIFGGNFAPAGWLFCEGQLLPISENDALFTLIGTTYGGDGQSTFGLPDLRGRVPVHQTSTANNLAETGGAEQVTLTVQQIPNHTHPFLAAAVTGTATSAANNLPAHSQNITPYINQSPDANMNPAVVSPVGGSQPHTNLQPFLCLSFIISLFGIFPTQT
jgi:microcystin-dependent protein